MGFSCLEKYRTSERVDARFRSSPKKLSRAPARNRFLLLDSSTICQPCLEDGPEHFSVNENKDAILIVQSLVVKLL
ncbi:hypothetical protein CDAR_473931 [Caerostris darwini]|uniref:Uncharacterized protein n=1 Tax=Caerostris darwini TaxID=1538125 RepID=A0AAV4SGA6_9ARAC|nr:hypothetical protein CDAR_473931 [Caerostris darwini]